MPLTRYETSRRSGKRRGVDVNIEMPRPSLFSPSLPPSLFLLPGVCGALHLPVPFKARNELAPISKASERRSGDEGTPSLAKAKFDLPLNPDGNLEEI